MKVRTNNNTNLIHMMNLKNNNKSNLKLYDDLIVVNKSSNAAGMTADYDLEILKTLKK